MPAALHLEPLLLTNTGTDLRSGQSIPASWLNEITAATKKNLEGTTEEFLLSKNEADQIGKNNSML